MQKAANNWAMYAEVMNILNFNNQCNKGHIWIGLHSRIHPIA